MTATRDDLAQPAPRLIATRRPDHPVGVALVLHGGAGRGSVPVSATQLSVLRMVPIAARVGRAGHGRIAVFRLLNATRGFGADPLSNLRWALGELNEQYADLPVCLVGHSLGGSVALAGAGQPGVRSVVALAPWLSGTESVEQLRDRPTLVVHGSKDRITIPTASEHMATNARAAGAPVSYVRVNGGEHTMLRRMHAFDVLAARFVHAVLDPTHNPGYQSRLERLAISARDEPGDYAI